MADVEVTKDEADRKQFDALDLKNKDPNKVYRWSRDKDMNVARHKFNGYDIVDSKTDKVESVMTPSTRMKKGEDVDTTVRVADMVLMSTSKENHEKLLKQRQEKINRQTRSVADDFKRAARSTGGSITAYEEHSENRGMSGKAAAEYEREKAHEEARERERLLKG